jgi:4-diphosphocytidyl-2-C-methyl-D-erythritol kinase
MTVKRVEVLAYAKINLMLDIIRRRTDGYHDLFMIMQSVGVADRVTVEHEPGRKLRLTASIDDIPLDDKNIAWKAAATDCLPRNRQRRVPPAAL